MPSLSDQMLAAGCSARIEDIHGEQVQILDGPDAGKSFTAVIEVVPDDVFAGQLGGDPRGKRVVRFNQNSVPHLKLMGFIKTGDGRKWRAVRKPDGAYLTVDFEIIEFVGGKDS